ncbi:hypothetical protein [Streptomyces sp. P3]|nr:hypothetical protein [Streptomyces sp. P3]
MTLLRVIDRVFQKPFDRNRVLADVTVGVRMTRPFVAHVGTGCQ